MNPVLRIGVLGAARIAASFCQGVAPSTALHVTAVASRSAELNDIVTVHLIIHDLDDLRGALKPDADGQSWRGDAAALQARMAGAAA